MGRQDLVRSSPPRKDSPKQIRTDQDIGNRLAFKEELVFAPDSGIVMTHKVFAGSKDPTPKCERTNLGFSARK